MPDLTESAEQYPLKLGSRQLKRGILITLIYSISQ